MTSSARAPARQPADRPVPAPFRLLSRPMTLDPVGANVATNAVVVVLLFAFMYAIAGSPLGRLIGIRPDYPFL